MTLSSHCCLCTVLPVGDLFMGQLGVRRCRLTSGQRSLSYTSVCSQPPSYHSHTLTALHLMHHQSHLLNLSCVHTVAPSPSGSNCWCSFCWLPHFTMSFRMWAVSRSTPACSSYRTGWSRPSLVQLVFSARRRILGASEHMFSQCCMSYLYSQTWATSPSDRLEDQHIGRVCAYNYFCPTFKSCPFVCFYLVFKLCELCFYLAFFTVL